MLLLSLTPSIEEVILKDSTQKTNVTNTSSLKSLQNIIIGWQSIYFQQVEQRMPSEGKENYTDGSITWIISLRNMMDDLNFEEELE